MLNTYEVQKLDWQMPVIPGQYIYHYSMSKSIKYGDNSEKYDFLVMTPCAIHTKYGLYNDLTEINDIINRVRRQWT